MNYPELLARQFHQIYAIRQELKYRNIVVPGIVATPSSWVCKFFKPATYLTLGGQSFAMPKAIPAYSPSSNDSRKECESITWAISCAIVQQFPHVLPRGMKRTKLQSSYWIRWCIPISIKFCLPDNFICIRIIVFLVWIQWCKIESFFVATRLLPKTQHMNQHWS